MMAMIFSQWWKQYRNDVIMSMMVSCLFNYWFRRRSKKTSKLRVSGLVRGIHRWPVNSPHKRPVTRKIFPFDDVIMNWRDLAGYRALSRRWWLWYFPNDKSNPIRSVYTYAAHLFSRMALVVNDAMRGAQFIRIVLYKEPHSMTILSSLQVPVPCIYGTWTWSPMCPPQMP